ncbi:MAG: NADP-dependent oxidoreductase [Bacteroidales bacterium]|nr:NADP-dependent oxidoreductase [Bacteroidales bacterium]
MKAIVINSFGTPDVFEQAEVQKPEINNTSILIEVAGGSVNPVDWKQRQGNHRLLFGKKFPIVLGYDVAGKVVGTGKSVTRFQVGDWVCGVLSKSSYGKGLAQFAAGPENFFTKLENVKDPGSFAALSLAGLTSLQAIRDKGKLEQGQKILIIGAAGGVGHFAVQIARIMGADVYAVSSEKHRSFLEQFGPHTFIDYHKQDILQLNHHFDIIYDGVGKYSFLKCKHLLKPGGIYINTLPRPKILVHKLLALFTRGKKVRTILMKQIPEDLDQLVAWVKEEKLKLCIDKEFKIQDVASAHVYSEAGHTEGKILIRYEW